MLKNRLNFKVFIGALIIASVLLCGSILFIMVLRPSVSSPGASSVSAALTILPASTSTPRQGTQTPAMAGSVFETPGTALPGQMAIGVYVQITGTEGEGLHLRSSPSLESPPLLLGYDSEVFLVSDGPIEADGLYWWHLTAPYDQTRAGWAVVDYLTVIPFP